MAIPKQIDAPELTPPETSGTELGSMLFVTANINSTPQIYRPEPEWRALIDTFVANPENLAQLF